MQLLSISISFNCNVQKQWWCQVYETKTAMYAWLQCPNWRAWLLFKLESGCFEVHCFLWPQQYQVACIIDCCGMRTCMSNENCTNYTCSSNSHCNIGGRSKFLLLACGSKKGWNLLHYSRYCWMHGTTINFFMLVQPCITYSMNHTPLRKFNNETPWDSMRRYWDIMSHYITCMCNQSNETCTCNECLSVISVSSWVSAFFVCFVCVCQCMGGACMLFTTAWLKP